MELQLANQKVLNILSSLGSLHDFFFMNNLPMDLCFKTGLC